MLTCLFIKNLIALLYADDTIIMGENMNDLRANINSVYRDFLCDVTQFCSAILDYTFGLQTDEESKETTIHINYGELWCCVRLFMQRQ